MIRVLLCDDHALFRRGLALVLGEEDGIEVVGEADDGHTAVAMVAELQPDVVLLDVRMPAMGGIDAARLISARSPGTRIVMLTMSDHDDDLYEAVKAGAQGYLLKDVSVQDVVSTVRSVMTGQGLLSPPMASKLMAEFASMARAADGRAGAPQLTDREVQVLGLVAQSLSNRAIAARLQISENTVKNHVRNILDKLGLHSRMEAALYAVREKLVELP